MFTMSKTIIGLIEFFFTYYFYLKHVKSMEKEIHLRNTNIDNI